MINYNRSTLQHTCNILNMTCSSTVYGYSSNFEEEVNLTVSTVHVHVVQYTTLYYYCCLDFLRMNLSMYSTCILSDH